MKRFVTVLIVILSFSFLTSCGKREAQSVEDFKTLVHEVESISDEISQNIREIRDILQAYNQTVARHRRFQLKFEGNSISNEEIARLQNHLDDEEDESCRGLLSQTLELAVSINELNLTLHETKSKLPCPHRVRAGENHYGICMKYLRDECVLPRLKADSLLARAKLVGEILEGFDVWMAYSDGRFETFLTQGSACVSPRAFAKAIRQFATPPSDMKEGEMSIHTCSDSVNQSDILIRSVSAVPKIH